jgi:predicted alpha/beta-hydrolase family hydrolase
MSSTQYFCMTDRRTDPVLLLAHGAGAPMDSRFMDTVAA